MGKKTRQRILEKLATAFVDEDQDNQLASLTRFLENSSNFHYFVVLKDCLTQGDEIFHTAVRSLASDITEIETDEQSRLKAAFEIIWGAYLPPHDDTMLSKRDRGFNWRPVLSAPKLVERSTELVLVRILSQLPPETARSLLEMANFCGNCMHDHFGTYIEERGELALATLRKSGSQVATPYFAMAFVAYETYRTVLRRWKNEASGRRCVQHLASCVSAVVCGIAAGTAGVAAAAPVVGGVATLVGGVIVSALAAEMGCRVSEWLARLLLDLPIDEKVENAYRLLQVHHRTTSNDEINTRFRNLCVEHYENEGNGDEWKKVVDSMKLIRSHRGHASWNFPSCQC